MKRDSAQFVKLLTGIQPRIHAYILASTGDLEVAADVLQETNVVIWQKAEAFAGDAEHFAAWAIRIARFQVLAARQKLSRDRIIFTDDVLAAVAADAEALVDLDDRVRALRECMGKIADRHRKIIERRYGRGESVNDIARSIGMTANAVCQSLHRIRLALMRCINSRVAAASHR